jgi:hypothetical protein
MNSLFSHPPQPVTTKTSLLSGGGAGANAAVSAATTQIAALGAKTGAVTKSLVDWADSKSAGRALKALKTAENEAHCRLGMTAIEIAESHTRKAMVGGAMVVEAALVTDVVVKTSQSNTSLTNLSLQGTLNIMSNRSASLAGIEASYRRGYITDAERDELIQQSHLDHLADVHRHRENIQKGREALHSLSQKATGRIAGSDLAG